MEVGEQQHQKGKEGAALAKRWLDRTARVRIDFNAYEFPEMVKLPTLTGGQEGFDLYGFLLDEDGQAQAPLYVEVKNYDTEGSQGTKYLKYLANCYAVTAKAILDNNDKHSEFMWLTWHPFAVTTWTKLCTAPHVKTAVETHKAKVLGEEHQYDPAIAELVAGRLWVVVLGRRHEQLTMPKWLFAKLKAEVAMKEN